MPHPLLQDPVQEWLYDHVCAALNSFETDRKTYESYCYTTYIIEEIMLTIFSKSGREDNYFMICVYANVENLPTPPGEDYFLKICKGESIYPYEQVSYHVIVGERGEGERYSDHAYQIVSTMFEPEDV
jgi:hypothetical protein